LLTVCRICSKRGKPSNGRQNNQKRVSAGPKKIVLPNKITLNDSTILINNFSEVIRKSRTKQGLTHEQLGILIKERASLLRRIESGSLKPDEKLAKKLERYFRINLYTEVDFGE
jgi:putative transcription factor